jgi:hypothetical protein
MRVCLSSGRSSPVHYPCALLFPLLFARFQSHMAALKKIPGVKVLFGGELLDPATHSIPDCYGSFLPTAVQVLCRLAVVVLLCVGARWV